MASLRKQRHQARRIALQWLYQCDAGGDADTLSRDDFLATADLADETQAFAESLVDGVNAQQAAIDAQLAGVSTNWTVERMAVVDRNILRLAVFEMLHFDDTPPKVALNEAIELAKAFGTEKSAAFVNGVLDKLLRDAGAAPAGEERE